MALPRTPFDLPRVSMDGMSVPMIEMRPWDEGPKLAALNAAANVLYNAQLSGRQRPSIHDSIAPYIEEGAESVLRKNYCRGLEEGRRLAGRVSHIHKSGAARSNIHGYLFSDAIHASGQSIPSNHMVAPTLSPVIALSVATPLTSADANIAEIIAACNTVFAGLMIHSQRCGEPGRTSRLECQADNAHASHLVLGSRALPVQSFDLENFSATVEVHTAENKVQTSFGVDPQALRHLTASVRRSIALLGEIRPGEILVCPPAGEPLDFPLNASAIAKIEYFGTTQVSHTSAEFEEGFLPMNSVHDRESFN